MREKLEIRNVIYFYLLYNQNEKLVHPMPSMCLPTISCIACLIADEGNNCAVDNGQTSINDFDLKTYLN